MALFVGLRGCGRVCARTGVLTRSFSSTIPALEDKKDVIGVVGLGLMGHGIAQVAAANGYQVRALEMNEQFLDTVLFFVLFFELIV